MSLWYIEQAECLTKIGKLFVQKKKIRYKKNRSLTNFFSVLFFIHISTLLLILYAYSVFVLPSMNLYKFSYSNCCMRRKNSSLISIFLRCFSLDLFCLSNCFVCLDIIAGLSDNYVIHGCLNFRWEFLY